MTAMVRTDPARGDEVSLIVNGRRQRFRFDRFADGGRSVTCWGPITSQRQAWRTLPVDRLVTIHRKRIGR